MDRHIIIGIELDNGHIYCVEVLGSKEGRYFTATRMMPKSPVTISMEIDEDESLEDNLVTLYRGLERMEKYSKYIRDYDEDENEDDE